MKSPWGSNMLGFRNSFSGLDLRPWWHTECWMWWPSFLRATWSRNLLLHLPLFIRVHIELRARTWVLSLNKPVLGYSSNAASFFTSSGLKDEPWFGLNHGSFFEPLETWCLDHRSFFILASAPSLPHVQMFQHPVALFQLPCLVSKRPFKLLLLSQPSVV